MNKASRNRPLHEGQISWKNHINRLADEAQAANQKLVIHIKPWHLTDLGVSLEDGVNELHRRFDFIFLKRSNYLARECSSEFKKVAKENDSQKKIRLDLTRNLPEAELCGCLVERDDEHAPSLLAQTDCINDLMQRLVSPYQHVCIDYESHIKANPRVASDLVTRHLGIYHDYEYQRFRKNYNAKKNQWSDIPIREKIENIEEVERLVSGTPYAWMLEE